MKEYSNACHYHLDGLNRAKSFIKKATAEINRSVGDVGSAVFVQLKEAVEARNEHQEQFELKLMGQVILPCLEHGWRIVDMKLLPPKDDVRINWCAIWYQSVEGIMVPSWAITDGV